MPLTSDAASRLAEITDELKARRGRRDLIAFTQATFPQYKPEPVHRLIASELENVIAGECLRLMVFAPPQHGKTELVSVRFPAYWLGRRPDDPVIVASYAADRAYRISRHTRQTVESPEYERIFPGITTSRDSRAVDYWELAGGHRGSLLAAGVGGPITGHGTMLGIIDDPIKNIEQAYSSVYRDAVWDWYLSTFRTRIWEGGAIILIMTRWHEDDLAGRLLEQDADQWRVLHLPAIADAEDDPMGRAIGEPLAPGRFSIEALDAIKSDVQSIVWQAEYQGRPIAPSGNMFKRAWFGSALPEKPAFITSAVRYWDKAGTQDGGDYTAGVLMGRAGNLYYIIDVVRGQWSPAERSAVIRQVTIQDAAVYPRYAVWVEQEPGSGGKESALNTITDLAGYNVHADKVTGSKVIRANPFAAQCEVGNVKLIAGPWNAAFIDEVTTFPAGVHDDQCDAASGAFAKLAVVEYKAGSAKYA